MDSDEREMAIQCQVCKTLVYMSLETVVDKQEFANALAGMGWSKDPLKCSECRKDD